MQQSGRLTCGFPSAPWGVSGCPGCTGLAATSCFVNICCLSTFAASGGLPSRSSACAKTQVCVRVALCFLSIHFLVKTSSAKMQHTASLWGPCPLQQLHIIQPSLATHIISTS